MKNILVICLALCVLFIACKKKEKDEEPAPAPSGTTGGTTTGGNTGNGTSTYDALFEMLLSSVKSGTYQYPPSNSSRAFLSSQPVNNEAYSTLLNMGTVSLNGTVFANHSGQTNLMYMDTTYTNFSAPRIWSITGSQNFSATSFTHTTAYPVFAGFSQLPDSCSKSAGLSINLNGLSGCDFINLYLLGPSGSQFLFPKYFPGNSQSVGFSSSELSGIATGNSAFLYLTFCKDNISTVNGKKVNLRSAISFLHISFKVKN